MKRFLFYLATALLAGNLSASALASNYGMKTGDKPTGEMGMKPRMMGEHKMTGTIEKIDHQTGMMKMKTGVGDMELHFPPSSVKDLKPGDSITVQMGFTKEMKGGEMKR